MTPDLRHEIATAQEQESDFQEFKGKILSKGGPDFRKNEHRVLYFWEQIYVSSVGPLRKQILEEAHQSKFLFTRARSRCTRT
jgi:hypothetical protein